MTEKTKLFQILVIYASTSKKVPVKKPNTKSI